MDKGWELYWMNEKASLHLFKKKEFISNVFSEIKKYIKKTDLVLDLGCGANDYIKLLETQGVKGVGLDISVYALMRNKQLSVCGNCEKIPFKDNTFNVITAISLLEYAKDYNILDEIKRILKKDGVFISITPNSQSFTIKFGWRFLIPLFFIFKKEHKQVYQPFNKEEFLKHARDKGFDIIKISYMPITYLILPKILRPVFRKLGYFFKEEIVIILKKI